MRKRSPIGPIQALCGWEGATDCLGDETDVYGPMAVSSRADFSRKDRKWEASPFNSVRVRICEGKSA